MEPVSFLDVFFAVDVADVEVEPAVIIVVPQLGVHALVSVPADGRVADVGESAVAVVAEAFVRAEIVGEEQILFAVVVVVAVGHVERPTGVTHARLLGDVRKGAVAIVAIEDFGTAIASGLKVLVHDACVFEVEQINGLEIVADVKVKETIVVVVKPDGATAVAHVPDAGLGRDVGERAVAVVVVKAVRAPADDIEVGPAVVVVITPHRVNGTPVPVNIGEAGLGGHVGEGTVAVVAIEFVH